MNAPSKKVDKAPRLSANDWAQGALDLIAEQGGAAVAVEPLARRLGVTKGSFYWHFPSREALLRAALERWEQRELEEVFAQLEGIEDPRSRLEQLFRLVGTQTASHAIYSELLKAMDHAVVQPVMQRVSARRMDWLTLAYRQGCRASRPSTALDSRMPPTWAFCSCRCSWASRACGTRSSTSIWPMSCRL
jgi:AcrR family transcriptional regulator